MVILESRSPVGRPEQRLQHTGQVDEPITHQKEPVDNIDLNENKNEHRLLRGLEDTVDVGTKRKQERKTNKSTRFVRRFSIVTCPVSSKPRRSPNIPQ